MGCDLHVSLLALLTACPPAVASSQSAASPCACACSQTKAACNDEQRCTDAWMGLQAARRGFSVGCAAAGACSAWRQVAEAFVLCLALHCFLELCVLAVCLPRATTSLLLDYVIFGGLPSAPRLIL